VTAAAFSRRARRDLLQAADWISRDNRAAAQALLDAVVRLAGLIGTHPDMGRVRPELAHPDFRFLSVTGFPYIIVYSTRTGRPTIVRVIHSARDLPRVLRDLS
jgi:toxin ParE1/3/4